MTNHEKAEQELSRLKEIVDKNRDVLGETVLPAAAEVRSGTEIPELTDEQVEALYSNMAELGFGRESDLTLAEAGMNGAAVNIEGGKPNKIRAELMVALAGDHGPIVLTASNERKIDDDEKSMLGIDDDEEYTELESASMVVSSFDSFETAEGHVVEFGYYDESYEPNSDPTGQAALIGYFNKQPVYILEVSRSYRDDGSYSQPNPGELTLLTAQMLQAEGVSASKVATITGGLYGPTRSHDIIDMNMRLAREGNPLIVGMAAYGRTTMGEVTGTDPARPNIKQLVSEVSRLEVKLSN